MKIQVKKIVESIVLMLIHVAIIQEKLIKMILKTKDKHLKKDVIG